MGNKNGSVKPCYLLIVTGGAGELWLIDVPLPLTGWLLALNRIAPRRGCLEMGTPAGGAVIGFRITETDRWIALCSTRTTLVP
ncbi:MAG: hypothetical protein AAGF95_29450 [Chloroflexota bacterium]